LPPNIIAKPTLEQHRFYRLRKVLGIVSGGNLDFPLWLTAARDAENVVPVTEHQERCRFTTSKLDGSKCDGLLPVG
jgi:hypothetical protein